MNGRTWAGRIPTATSGRRNNRIASVSSLLTPGRIQASYFYKRVDAARFPVIDLALRQALNGGLEEKLDQELIAGAEGLLTGTNLANHAAAAVTTFATYLAAFGHARVDGRYAAALCGRAGRHGRAPRMRTRAGSTAAITPTTRVLDALDRKTGGVRVSPRTSRPWRATNRTRSSGSGMHDRAVLQVLWDGITSLVPDEVTKAKTGEVGQSRRSCWWRRRSCRASSFHKQEVAARGVGARHAATCCRRSRLRCGLERISMSKTRWRMAMW